MAKGFYNLPVEEQDKYNVTLTQEELREFYIKTQKTKIKRDNKLIHALDKESITSYLQRLKVILEALDEQSQQEHMYGVKGAWYVHKRAQNCFICDYSTMMNQVLDVLFDIERILPVKLLKSLTFGQMKEGSQLRLTNSKAH